MDPENSLTLTWGRNWFVSIGHDVTNPITLTLFFTVWVNLYKAALDVLEQMVV